MASTFNTETKEIWTGAGTRGSQHTFSAADWNGLIDQVEVLVSADRGDTSQTLTVLTDSKVQLWATALTADRTITLSTTNATSGDWFRIVRTGLGAGSLSIGSLFTFPPFYRGTATVMYNGSAWFLLGA